MENVKEKLSIMEDSDRFKDWRKKNPDSYLTHAFCMHDGTSIDEWQFGYYNKSRDKIATFVLDDDVSLMPESDVLKKDDLLNKLDIENVKVDVTKALEISKKCQEEKYKGQIPLKTIILLQHLNEGLVWNITYLTVAFKTLNIKVSAIDGKIADSSLKSLISQA